MGRGVPLVIPAPPEDAAGVDWAAVLAAYMATDAPTPSAVARSRKVRREICPDVSC
jgi:hypothetical protein